MLEFQARLTEARNEAAAAKFLAGLDVLRRLRETGALDIPTIADWKYAQEEELSLVDALGRANPIATDVLDKLEELPSLIQKSHEVATAAVDANVTFEDACAVAGLVRSRRLGYEVAPWQLELSASHRPVGVDGEWAATNESLQVYRVLDFLLDYFFEGSRMVLTALMASADGTTLATPLAPATRYRHTNDFRESVGLGSGDVCFADDGIETLDLGRVETLYNLVPIMASWQVNLTVDPALSRQVALAVLYLSRFWIPASANSRVWLGKILDHSSRLRIWQKVWGPYCQLWQGVPEADEMGFFHQVDSAVKQGYPAILPFTGGLVTPWDWAEAYVGRTWNVLGRFRTRGGEVNPANVFELRALDVPPTRNDGTAISMSVVATIAGLLDRMPDFADTSAAEIARMEAEIPLVYAHGIDARIEIDGRERPVREHADHFTDILAHGCGLLGIPVAMCLPLTRKLRGDRRGACWQFEIEHSMRSKRDAWGDSKRSRVMLLLTAALRRASERGSRKFADVSDWPIDIDEAIATAAKFGFNEPMN